MRYRILAIVAMLAAVASGKPCGSKEKVLRRTSTMGRPAMLRNRSTSGAGRRSRALSPASSRRLAGGR